MPSRLHAQPSLQSAALRVWTSSAHASSGKSVQSDSPFPSTVKMGSWRCNSDFGMGLLDLHFLENRRLQARDPEPALALKRNKSHSNQNRHFDVRSAILHDDDP